MPEYTITVSSTIQYTAEEELSESQQQEVADEAAQGAANKVGELGGEVISRRGVIHDPEA